MTRASMLVDTVRLRWITVAIGPLAYVVGFRFVASYDPFTGVVAAALVFILGSLAVVRHGGDRWAMGLAVCWLLVGGWLLTTVILGSAGTTVTGG